MKTLLGNNSVCCKTFTASFDDDLPLDLKFAKQNETDKKLERRIRQFVKTNKAILNSGRFRNPILKIEELTSFGVQARYTVRKMTVYFIVKFGKEKEAQKIFDSEEQGNLKSA